MVSFLQELIEKAEEQPNLTIGVLVSIVVVFFSLFIKLIFGGKKVIFPLQFSCHFNMEASEKIKMVCYRRRRQQLWRRRRSQKQERAQRVKMRQRRRKKLLLLLAKGNRGVTIRKVVVFQNDRRRGNVFEMLKLLFLIITRVEFVFSAVESLFEV